jgi:hypothetical protein
LQDHYISLKAEKDSSLELLPTKRGGILSVGRSHNNLGDVVKIQHVDAKQIFSEQELQWIAEQD